MGTGTRLVESAEGYDLLYAACAVYVCFAVSYAQARPCPSGIVTAPPASILGLSIDKN